MSLQFGCQNCGKNLKVPNGSSGKRVKCPQCEAVNVIPEVRQADVAKPVAPPLQPPTETRPTPSPAPPRAAPPIAPPVFSEQQSSETQNPFQSPSTESYTEPAPLAVLTHRRIDLGDVVTQSWRRFKPNMGFGALFAIIFIVVSMVFGMVSFVLQVITAAIGIPALVILAVVVGQIFQQCGGAYQQCMSKRFGLNVARGGTDVLSDIFSVRPLLPVTLMFLLIIVAFLGLVAIAAAPFGIVSLIDQDGTLAPIGLGISVVLGVAMGIFFFLYVLRLFLCIFFMVDRKASIFESFKQSARYMHGNKFVAFGTMFVVGMLGSLTVLLTCGLGVFVVLPFLETVQAVIYLKATGQYRDIAA